MKTWKVMTVLAVLFVLMVGGALVVVNGVVELFSERREAWVSECTEDHPRYECERMWRPWI